MKGKTRKVLAILSAPRFGNYLNEAKYSSEDSAGKLCAMWGTVGFADLYIKVDLKRQPQSR